MVLNSMTGSEDWTRTFATQELFNSSFASGLAGDGATDLQIDGFWSDSLYGFSNPMNALVWTNLCGINQYYS